MAEIKNYHTLSNYTDHSRFGGEIYNYDFDGYNSISDTIKRIISDIKFDKRCKKNAENRDKNKECKKGIK